jgi:signal transduction histidine kinase
MMKSLRSRLLLWYSLILSLVILSYAGAVTYLYRQSLLQQVDAELTTQAAAIASGVTVDIDGTFDLNVPPSMRNGAPGETSTGEYYAVWNGAGQIVDQSDPSATPDSRPELGVITRADRRELVIDARGRARILVGRPLDIVNAAVRQLRLTVAVVGGLVLLVSVFGGFVLVGRALAPVARISQTAGAMIGGDLDARIPVKGTASELEQVAFALNEAFDRMRLVADHERQFTADASHELRTPLSVLRAEFDWVMSRPRSVEEYQASITKGQKAVERMTELADRLLTLARPGGADSVARTDLELTTVLNASVELLSPLSSSHGVTIRTDYQPAHVSGVRSLLIDAFGNLIKNGIEYNRPGGQVVVQVRNESPWVVATVRDTGVGINADDLPRVFERFYRADRSRTRGGAGLGLAIVKSIVENHGGTVTCSSTPGVGTEFKVRLPVIRT